MAINRLLHSLAALAALFPQAAAAQGTAGPGDLPDWLEGHWQACQKGMAVTEIWTGAGSGLLVGISHTLAKGKPGFEFMRIGPGPSGKPAFFASPGGKPPVIFEMIASDTQRVVFENKAHDFPQRVIYQRVGAGLTARIEGEEGGKAKGFEWAYQASAPGSRCKAG